MRFKIIKGYNNYAVSENGNVYNLTKNKMLSHRINKDGYDNVYLYQNGSGKNFRVHRLVAEAFIPNPNNYKEINHIDHNPSNNDVSNLEWCDRTYNNRYSRAKKVYQYDLNNKLLKIWDCVRDVEREIGINHSAISMCCNKKINTAGGYKWRYEFNE